MLSRKSNLKVLQVSLLNPKRTKNILLNKFNMLNKKEKRLLRSTNRDLWLALQFTLVTKLQNRMRSLSQFNTSNSMLKYSNQNRNQLFNRSMSKSNMIRSQRLSTIKSIINSNLKWLLMLLKQIHHKKKLPQFTMSNHLKSTKK